MADTPQQKRVIEHYAVKIPRTTVKAIAADSGATIEEVLTELGTYFNSSLLKTARSNLKARKSQSGGALEQVLGEEQATPETVGEKTGA